MLNRQETDTLNDMISRDKLGSLSAVSVVPPYGMCGYISRIHDVLGAIDSEGWVNELCQ